MKKKILLLSVFICCVTTVTTTLFAQGTLRATWALSASSTNTSAVTGTGTSSVTASSMGIGSTFTGGAYNTDGIKCSSSVTWPTTETTGYSLDFPVSPNNGFDLRIDSFALIGKVSGGSGNQYVSFAYIIDGGTPVDIASSQQTFASGSTTTIAITKFGSSIICTNGHTLTIRAWIYAASASSSRNFFVKSVVFAGTTTTASIPLPVSFADVQASSKNGGITVEWSANTEVNTDKYIVQRSGDGNSFTDAASVVAKGGNNTTINQYSWFDATPSGSTNFYRIKAVDKDGGFAYSSTIKINSDAINLASLVITPNPIINKQVNLRLNGLNRGSYLLNVYNTTGQLVFVKSISYEGGVSSFTLVLPATINKGMYSVQVSNETIKIAKQILIQ